MIAALLALVVAACPAPYADRRFVETIGRGFARFYARDFPAAQRAFTEAEARCSDESLALSFAAAAASRRPGGLAELIAAAEAGAALAPDDYLAQVRLGFARLVVSPEIGDRRAQARNAFEAAIRIAPARAAARVGLGILRFDDRSPSRAKAEFLAALRAEPHCALAREYLALLYQTDLHDPRTGLGYAVDVANLLPGYADIRFHIASLLADLGAPEAALSYDREALALDVGRVGEAGRYGDTLAARLLIASGRPREARTYLDDAIAADVDAVYARALREKLAGDPGGPPTKDAR